MYYFFFYFFTSIALLSAIYAVFFEKNKLASITIFILSVSGILVLNNAGYIAFILIFSFLLYYTIRKIYPIKDLTENKINGNNKFTFTIIASVFGAIIASVAGSTMWQGEIILNNAINLSNLLTVISFEYFIFFLLVFSAIPLILFFIKFRGES